MMMKVAKLGWVGPAGQGQGWSKARVGLKHEQGRSRAGTGQEQSTAKQGRKKAEAGQDMGRSQ